MKPLLLVVAVILAGCEVSQPVNVIHKEGSMSADRLRAFDLCDFEAIKAIPRAMAVSTTGGYYNPGSLQCSTVGQATYCNRVGAVNIPSSSTTYDANLETRVRYIDRCLEAKGYSVLKRPACTSDADKLRERSQLDKQPPASQIKCAVGR